MNLFGGDWTREKIDIVVLYAKAYLTIMNKYPQFKCLYFDGFAGSGDIYQDDKIDFEILEGAALRILEIDQPKSFDIYYFVELNKSNKEQLEATINKQFPNKRKYVVEGDCNKKLFDLAEYLKKNSKVRVLAFIDPYGMALNWGSIQILQGLGVDLWILVPTGIGMNRLLKRNGDIRASWVKKLENFLGMSGEDIKNYFYKSTTFQTLFGTETITEKERDAINKACNLYQKRLNDVFKFVSESLPLKNSTGSIMYHLVMASNNVAAFGIANDIIKGRKNS